MATKKYYWLQLKKDFFKKHDIRIVEAMENGKDYILFYLKLLCESVDHEGTLRFSDQIPYNEQMLAVITNTNVDVVRTAIKVFTELQLMDVLDDGTIYMREVEKMIGCASQDEHTRESTRLRVQKYRERQKEGQIEDKRYSNVTCNGEIEIEKEIDIYNKYMVNFETLWKLYPRKVGKGEAYKKYKARLNDGWSEEELLTAVKNYSAECKKNRTADKYIKHAKTFFSDTTPFADYLDKKGGVDNGHGTDNVHNAVAGEVEFNESEWESHVDENGCWKE